MPDDSNRRITFREAFRFWVKLGFISFGGPAGQIAIMHRELVEKRKWLSEERFLHALSYCMLLPGPEATELAIYIGWLMHRTIGGVVAGAFFVLPSILVLLALSYIYAAYGNVPVVLGLLFGFKPVVVAIVVEAILKIGGRALKRWVHYIIAVVAFVSIYFLRVPFPLIVLVAGLIGLIGSVYLPAQFKVQNESEPSKTNDSDLVIKDEAPPPEHTRPSKWRIVRVLLAGTCLWLLPFFLLIIWLGASSLPSQEYLFFSKASFVTFGGAYAVLAYITQAAVLWYGWITHAQAVDGLALAETTPGPLIMVSQFIGFVAAWNAPPTGMSPAMSGVVGALGTTWVTFLPSFLFIFLGGPYIEKLRGNTYLTGALSGITAAVVGVILNLAIVFGIAVILPTGELDHVNWPALVLTAAAFFALYRLKIDVLWVVLGGGILGLLITWTFGGALGLTP